MMKVIIGMVNTQCAPIALNFMVFTDRDVKEVLVLIYL